MQFHDKNFFSQIPVFLQFQKYPKINFWTVKKFKTARNAISCKNIFDLFDFMSLFAGTFFNFLIRCVLIDFFSWTYFEIWVSQVNGTESLILFPAFCSSNSPGNLELKKSSWLSGYLKMEKIHFCRRKYNQHSKALCTIFTILQTLWNSEQKNGLLIILFGLLSHFNETFWNCSTHG